MEESLNNMELELLGLIAESSAYTIANYDGRKKEIGDKVIIWDWSYCKDVTGKDHDKFTGYDNVVGIVIQTDCNYHSESFLGIDRFCDLLVAYNDGTKIYTLSDFVRMSNTDQEAQESDTTTAQ